MANVHKTLFLTVAFIYIGMQYGFCQGKEYQDFYITEKGDTLYGTFRSGFLKAFLWEEVNKSATKPDGRFVKHEVKGGRGCRYNDFFIPGPAAGDTIYHILLDPADVPALALAADYVITTARDTLYGTVHTPAITTPYIVTAGGKKVKIKEGTVIAYKKGIYAYEYRQKPRAYNFDKKEAFLPCLYNGGAVKLFGYKDESGPCYFLEKEGQLHLVYGGNYIEMIEKLLPDNSELHEMVRRGTYGFENMYLIVKYYVSHKK
jgi:hypothetical protein